MADPIKTPWKVQPEHFLGGQAKDRVESVASGKSRATLLPLASAAIPEHLRTINTEHGTVLYDPKKIRARGIRRALQFGRFHEVVDGAQRPASRGLSTLFKTSKEIQ